MKLDLPFFSTSLDEISDTMPSATINNSNRSKNNDNNMSNSNNRSRPNVVSPSPVKSPAKRNMNNSRLPTTSKTKTTSASEAAYLCVKTSLAQDLESDEELISALTIAGES